VWSRSSSRPKAGTSSSISPTRASASTGGTARRTRRPSRQLTRPKAEVERLEAEAARLRAKAAETRGETAPAADPIARLAILADLHEPGALTDGEFAAEKAKILDRN
jgi:hypothetical protein